MTVGKNGKTENETEMKMALISKIKPAVEANPDTAAAAAPISAQAQATTGVVATPRPSAVAVAGRMQPTLETLKNAMPVEYNTLPQLQVLQGNYILKGSSVNFGDQIEFELLSYQDQWSLSPGVDGEEAGKLVRYSDDGLTTSVGEDCRQYIQTLKDEGYPKAEMKARVLLVLNLLDSSKKVAQEHLDKLYQVDLSTSSKTTFDGYRHQAAYSVAKGKISLEEACRMLSTVVLTTNKAKQTYSVAHFAAAPAAPAA